LENCPPRGKIIKKRKRGEKKNKAAVEPLMGVWKRRSVFWDLPYWKILSMHITKNVCESLLGTLFNMLDRTKDGPKGRNDLMALNIRK
jgi:hypothetical protein